MACIPSKKSSERSLASEGSYDPHTLAPLLGCDRLNHCLRLRHLRVKRIALHLLEDDGVVRGEDERNRRPSLNEKPHQARKYRRGLNTLGRAWRRLAALTVGSDIDIKFTGIRAGEKLYEEMFFSAENVIPTEHPKVLRARGGLVADGGFKRIDALSRAADDGESDEQLRQLILGLVSDFHIHGTIRAQPKIRQATITIRRAYRHSRAGNSQPAVGSHRA